MRTNNVRKNALKSILLETAIEQLSKSNKEPTLYDVRATLNDLLETLTDNIEVEVKYGGKVNYEMRTMSFRELGLEYNRSDEAEVLSSSIEAYWNHKDFKCEIQKDTKVSDWLKILKDAAFFIPANEIKDFIKWSKHYVEDIQYTCEHGDVRKDDVNGLHMKFDSTVKGVGKSYFIKNLVDGAKALGIPAKNEVSMPRGGFENSLEESRNLVVGYNEADRHVDETTLKNIGRREHYKYSVKYQGSSDVQSRAITLGSSNGYDYCKDDRTFVTFHCIPARFQDYPDEIQKKASDVTSCITRIYTLKQSKFWISGFLSYKYCIDNKNINNKNNSQLPDPEFQKLLDFLRKRTATHLLIDVLSSLNGDLELLGSISISKLSKLYYKYNGLELTYNQKTFLSELLNNMYANGLIKKTGYESNDLYIRFDLSKLIGLRHEDLFEESEVTFLDEIQKAQEEWDRIIKLAEDFEKNNPDPDYTNDKSEEISTNSTDETDVEIKEEADMNFESTKDTLESYTGRWFLDSRMQTKVEDTNVFQPYVALNKPKKDPPEPDHMRKDVNFTGNNFCFEIDDLPLDEQKELISKFYKDFKDNILWICSSGNKSVHCVLHTNCNTNETAARKYIQQYFNKKYFNNHLDMSTANAGRICRNPNGIREDGREQTCYYLNEDAEMLDVYKQLDEYNQIKQREEQAAKARRLVTQTNNESHPLTVDYLKTRRVSPGREKAIAMLERTAEWYDMSSACLYLLGTGFSREQIEDTLAGDKWLPNALKYAEKILGL